MRRAWLAALAGAAVASATAFAAVQGDAKSLRSASDFASISSKAKRSVALFTEAGKVIQHPRCVNCHPAGDRPLQGDDEHIHNPPVVRGAADIGATGLQCPTCHQTKNTPLETTSIKSMPGNPQWRLAPIEMAWAGKTLGQICTQIKDKSRNGGKDLEALHTHMASDDLVGWGWSPGAGHTPAPGTQKQFGELIRAWIDSGAECPEG
jgi:hypothetical protein